MPFQLYRARKERWQTLRRLSLSLVALALALGIFAALAPQKFRSALVLVSSGLREYGQSLSSSPETATEGQGELEIRDAGDDATSASGRPLAEPTTAERQGEIPPNAEPARPEPAGVDADRLPDDPDSIVSNATPDAKVEVEESTETAKNEEISPEPKRGSPIAAQGSDRGDESVSNSASEIESALEQDRLIAALRNATEDRLALAKGGVMRLASPFHSLARPIQGEDIEMRSAVNYAYGTDGGGEYLLHHGIDIGNPVGTPVQAIAAGRVVFAGQDIIGPTWGPGELSQSLDYGFYGRLVVIEHKDLEQDGVRLFSLYGHLDEIAVRRRQLVEEGQAIGTVGSAGVALGPHLHLEIRRVAEDYQSVRNPSLFLGSMEGEGLVVGRVVDAVGRPLHELPVSLYQIDESGGTQWIRSTTTYPADGAISSTSLGENFAFADLAEGEYLVSALAGGGAIEATVKVIAGSASGILLKRASD